MIELKQFRLANQLTQDQLGEFLGMKKSYISKIEHGKERLPYLKHKKLMENLEGWDISMLPPATLDNCIMQNGVENTATLYNKGVSSALKAENEAIKRELEMVKAERDRYWDALCKFMDNAKQ